MGAECSVVFDSLKESGVVVRAKLEARRDRQAVREQGGEGPGFDFPITEQWSYGVEMSFGDKVQVIDVLPHGVGPDLSGLLGFVSSALRRTFLLHDGCLWDLVTTRGCDARRERPESAVIEPAAPPGATRGDMYGVTALKSKTGHWACGKLYVACKSWEGARALAEALRSTRGSDSHVHVPMGWKGGVHPSLAVGLVVYKDFDF